MNTQSPYGGHLGHSVKRLYYVMELYFNSVLRPYGVARSQWYMLYAVSQSPGITQKKLQATLGVESATLTTAVDALVRKGWVERKQSTSDRRVKELHFTTAGSELWRQLPDPVTALRAQMLMGIGAKDEKTARKILDKAAQNLQQ